MLSPSELDELKSRPGNDCRSVADARMRVEPQWPELRKATALRAIARVLEIVQGDARLIDALREAM